MAGFDVGKLTGDVQDIFTRGLDKAVDIELGLTPRIEDDQSRYKPGDPNLSRQGSQVSGKSGLFNASNNTLLIIGGVGVLALLGWAVFK